MDGVSHYVTVRRDLFTGLVASSTSIPITTLAITKQKHLFQSNQETTVSTTTNTPSRTAAEAYLIRSSSIGDSGQVSGSARLRNNSSSSSDHECGLCAKSFASKGLLTRHIKSHSIITTSPIEGLSCDQPGCSGRSFTSQLSLAKHLKSHHHHQVLMAEIESGGGSPCGIEFQRSSSLSEGSSKRNPGEKRFQCGQCSKRFPTSKDLKRHDVVHTGNREFQCSFCSHRFGRKDHRMRHEKKTHANEMQLSSSPLSPLGGSKIIGDIVVDKRRWRHVSSPSVASSTGSPIMADMEQMVTEQQLQHVRIRAMSTCEQRMDGPLYNNKQFVVHQKQQESELSPESLLMEEAAMSPPDFSAASTGSLKEESSNEDTCHSSNGGEDVKPTATDLDWIMSDLIKPEAANFVESVLSPSSPDTGSPSHTPEPSSSLSPAGLYPPSDIIPPSSNNDKVVTESPPQQQLSAIVIPTMATTRCAKQVMSDMLTRTKNPVLPSVYIDNSLIVPEPSKQKYHNPHPLLSPEDMDDYYEAFMDDKDITETLFHSV